MAEEECNPKVTCDTKNLTWEQLVRMLTQVAEGGCAAINTIVSLPS